MDDLHEFVQGQFAQFAGAEEYEWQLSIWAYGRHDAKKREHRDWRRRNRHNEKRYYEENRTAILLRAHQRYAANRDTILARQKVSKAKWNDKHRDILRASDRKWRSSLPADECWCRAKKVPGRSLCHEHLMANRKRSAERYAAKKQQEGRVG